MTVWLKKDLVPDEPLTDKIVTGVLLDMIEEIDSCGGELWDPECDEVSIPILEYCIRRLSKNEIHD